MVFGMEKKGGGGWGLVLIKGDQRDRSKATCNPGLAPGFEGAERGSNEAFGECKYGSMLAQSEIPRVS